MIRLVFVVTTIVVLCMFFTETTRAVPVYFRLCTTSTCEPSSVLAKDGVILEVSSIRSVSASTECPETCSDINIGGQKYHVLGHWMDILCKLFPGDECIWDQQGESRAEAYERERKMTTPRADVNE